MSISFIVPTQTLIVVFLLKMKLKLLKIPKNKQDHCHSGLWLGLKHKLIMAWIVHPYSQDTCGIGSGSFAALE
jgi:hypothetical protein